MAQPLESLSPWHQIASDQIDRELNPVVSPYNKNDVEVLHEDDGITIDTRVVTFKDGLRYHVTSSRIDGHIPDGLDGVSHFENVGWTTRPRGLYVERLKTLAGMGIEGTVAGIPLNKGKWISYDEHVHNLAAIHINEANVHDRDPRIAILSGLSQAAMNGTGFMVLGERDHNINTASAHLNVLCLPDGIKIRGIKDLGRLACHLKETLKNMPYELHSIKSILELDEESKAKLLPTVDATKDGPITQIQMLRSLLSGKTGEYARQMPTDIPIIAELKEKDMLSRAHRWIDGYLGDRPNVKINFDPEGTHAGCFDEVNTSNWTDYNSALAEVLREYPQFRSNPRTLGSNLLNIMRVEYPQFTKPSHLQAA